MLILWITQKIDNRTVTYQHHLDNQSVTYIIMIMMKI